MNNRDHHCPRCGGYLPVVTVRKRVYREVKPAEGDKPMLLETLGYQDVEEVADCVRCTGGY